MTHLTDIADAVRDFSRAVKTRLTLAGSDARLIRRSGLFDDAWYAERYPDVARRGYPPLVHYLRFGAAEGRSPNSLFDGDWYRDHNPGLDQARANPLVHYIRNGGQAAPSPGFDPAWYRAQNPDLAGLDPLAHFFSAGRAAGRLPRPPLRDFHEAGPNARGPAWRIAIKIPAPSKSRAEWGEFHFAEGLRDSFRRLGHHAVIDFRNGWYTRHASSDDLVIVLRGALAYEPDAAHFNILWNISHPELVSPEECNRYDLVYVASNVHARPAMVDVPTRALLQATDASRFHLLLKADRKPAGILFVGNSHGVYRTIVRWAVEAGLEPEIYGKGWQQFVPTRLIKGDAVDNRLLGALYAGAKVVLNDHWPSMRAAGLISNRAFDVVASGGVLVSDSVAGIGEVFGGVVQEVDGPETLRAAVERAVALVPEARAEAARRTAKRHSFDARAAQIVSDVAALAGESDWKERRLTRPAAKDDGPAGRTLTNSRASTAGPAPAFSIVVPVYNAGQYLEECLDSVRRQRRTGGVEIIVVDDGSTDDSLAIAKRYGAAHPGVTVLTQPNRGPSAARNAGAARVRGKYVNFLDADDKLGRGVLRSVRRFFERHGETIDVVTVPIFRFGGRRGQHPLNAKFRRGPRVVDLDREPDAILRHTTSSFIRRSALPATPFDEAIRYGEDAELILRALLKRRKYGVVSGAKLLKRSRSDGSSLLDRLYDDPANLRRTAGWHRAAIDGCLKRFGSVPPFVQASVLYDYQWQARSPRFGFAFRDPAERAAYMTEVRAILAHIDPERIRVARQLNAAERILLRELRNGAASGQAAIGVAGWELPDVEVLFIGIEDHVTIEFKAFVEAGGSLTVTVNGAPAAAERNPTLDASLHFFGEDAKRYAGFCVAVPRQAVRLAFAWDNGGGSTPLRITYGPHSGLAVRGGERWGVFGGLAFRGKRDGLAIDVPSPPQRLWREAGYIAHLVARLRLRQAALRMLAHAVRPGGQAATMIFLDRVEGAGDNAEHLFRYVHERDDTGGRRLFFCVAPASPDYRRLAKIGMVLAYGSLRHRIEMFRAGVVVSSHGNPPTFNPFGRDERFLRDLLRFKRAFVQHGVMNTTQCQWCGREALNLSLFTTTARREYEMILTAPIGYTAEQVRLTGMPRFDRLTRQTGDTIVLMPTWRKGLLDEVGQLATFGERAAAFAASVFASEWRAIAESEEAARLKQSHGVKVTLVWHPQIYSAFRRWSGGSEAKVEALLGREPNDFETLKNTAALLVTDYSSISFDFAYLGKPVAYYQFDADKMLTDRAYHRYRPDFDFAGEGFGPVIRSRGDVLRWIVEATEGGGMKEPFRSRAAQFFPYRDKNNCRRVWAEIVRLTSSSQA